MSKAMTGHRTPKEDEDTRENDVHYGIADCRRRLRSRRSTLRAQHPPPIGVSNGAKLSPATAVASYAEILATVSMSQSSLSRLVEFLLEPPEPSGIVANESEEREEALRT